MMACRDEQQQKTMMVVTTIVVVGKRIDNVVSLVFPIAVGVSNKNRVLTINTKIFP